MGVNFFNSKYEKKFFVTDGCYRNDKYFSASFFNTDAGIKDISDIIGISLDIILEMLESKFLVKDIGIKKEKRVFNVGYKLLPLRNKFDRYLSKETMDEIINKNKGAFSKMDETALGFFFNKGEKVFWSLGRIEKQGVKEFLNLFVNGLSNVYNNSPFSLLERKWNVKKDAYLIFMKLLEKSVNNSS